MTERLVIGCMTGTSCDGLDVALVRVQGHGLGMRAQLVDHASLSLAALGTELQHLAAGAACSIAELARIRRDYMQLHSEAIQGLVGERAVDLVAIHGQTLFHRPPLSWQLADPSWLANQLAMPVVADLRAADLAHGGQGAPITPLADHVLFAESGRAQAIVNLGGFCNITFLPASGDPAQIHGRDVCSCNQLLDGLARKGLGHDFDHDGACAATGSVDSAYAEWIYRLLAAQDGPQSLGSGDELSEQVLAARDGRDMADVLASAVVALVTHIAQVCGDADRVILAGGGCLHQPLVRTLADNCQGELRLSNDLGVPVQQREAMAMAILGALSKDGLPITLPAVTGVDQAPVAGLWAWPGIAPHAAAEPDTRSAGGSFAGLAEGLPQDRSQVLSEQRHVHTTDLHSLSVTDCVARLQAVDGEVLPACQRAAPALTGFIEAMLPGFRRGGRLVYFGAGTSGRLGVLDASEAPPTFHVPPDRIIGLIAGGDSALRRSSEGKEDDPDGAVAALQALGLGAHDAILGIAAGGTTPYVRGGLAWAAALPNAPVTGLLSCSPCTLPPGVGHLICADTGPEALTGSTRMKAGTATKLLLNTLSTTLMIQDGRVFTNLMVDLRASNEKLRDRALRIISTVLDLDRQTAWDVLQAADGEVKLAIVMQQKACSAQQARAALARVGGRLADVLEASDATRPAESE